MPDKPPHYQRHGIVDPDQNVHSANRVDFVLEHVRLGGEAAGTRPRTSGPR